MSDSDDDILQRNCLTFQNESTTVWARGPNITTNMTGLSFRNNVLTSTLQMPTNLDRPRHMEPNFDHRSVYSRRETSPMSNFDCRSAFHRRDMSPTSNYDPRSAYYRRGTSPMSHFERRSAYHRRETSPMSNFEHKRSFYQRETSPMSNIDHRRGYYRREVSPMSMYGGDARRHNYDKSYYPRNIVGPTGSQRSVVNGRSGSPMSVRSTASNTSISAQYIAMAFKNTKFNKFDQRLIKEAYSKYMNNKVKRKIQKRRNLRLFMKNAREKDCDSTTSSDDESSTKGSAYYGYMSSCRSTNTDIVDFRRTITESNMFKDCSNSLRRNTFKNVSRIAPLNVNSKPLVNKPCNPPPQTQKERFENGFLLPSQRFNKSTAVLPIQEANECDQNNKDIPRNEIVPTEHCIRNGNRETDSDQDEIFSEVTVREKSMVNKEPERKRSLNNEDNIYMPHKKRHKLSSPLQSNDKTKKAISKQNKSNINNKANGKDVELSNQTKVNNNNKENGKANDFEFVKPSLPLKKSKNKTNEKLISKSAQPMVEHNTQNEVETQVLQTINRDEEKLIESSQVSELSMRPSFIKRKLFSQKLDVTEKQNICAGNSSLNSPQANIYSAIQNEKHKARKLVTSLSCLSRDVREGNNLLDLIHKIVPPDQMSNTQMNKTDTIINKNTSEDNDDKWDITSVISTCNDDKMSDTYTDEEIFTDKSNDMPNKLQKPAGNKKFKTDGKKEVTTLVQKSNNIVKSDDVHTLNKPEKTQASPTENVPKKKSENYVKSFWDIDSESDVDCAKTPKQRSHITTVKEVQKTCNTREINKNQLQKKPEARHNKTINNSMTASDAYKTLNNTHRILSHHSPKTKKSDNELTKKNYSKSTFLDTSNKITNTKKVKNNKVIKPHKPLKNVHVSPRNDTSPIVNIKTNHQSRTCKPKGLETVSKTDRQLRTCRLNASLNDTREVIKCNRSLKVIITPVKMLNKISNKNIAKITDVKARKSDVSFSLVSDKPIPLVNKIVNESTNSKTRGKSKETRNRKSDVSFSLPSNKKSREEKNAAKNKQNISASKNNSNKTGDSKMNFSMTLRSSKSPAFESVVAKKEIRSKASTRMNGSKIY